jgi:aspartyl protease family protein
MTGPEGPHGVRIAVSNFWKFTFVIVVASLAGLASAQAVVFRAASAEAAISAANAEAAQGDVRAIRKSSDGHYWANGRVNGENVRFLVDTGATAVSLTPDDARRLGFEPGSLNYKSQVITASGPARAAPVKLANLTVSGARIDNVDALVIERGLDTSLLGMTYLGRLSSFQATRQALILLP